jgi:hypothetical protein
MMMRNTMPVKGDEDEGSSLTGQHSNEVPMPPGWRILAEGEESVVSFLRAEGETDSGIEAILDHPGPDWYTGVWLDEHRGYEGQMRTVTYRDGVYRIESGPEDDFWADSADGEDDEL